MDYCDQKAPKKDHHMRGDFRGRGWYRFEDPAGTILSQTPPGKNRCGSCITGWSNSTLPGEPGQRSYIDICWDFSKDSGNADDCVDPTRGIATNCGSFYVYYFEETQGCRFRYCASEEYHSYGIDSYAYQYSRINTPRYN